MTPIEMKDHATNFLLWSLRLIIVLLSIALCYFILQSVSANAVECRSNAGDDSYWRWRYVKPYEHKRCWYRGRQQLPKSDLYWSKPEPKKQDDDSPQKRIIDPVFPKHIKIVNPNDFNELDAQAGREPFFNAKPMTWWPSVTPFTPWTERVAGAFQ